MNYSAGLGFSGYDERGRAIWNLLDNAEIYYVEVPGLPLWCSVVCVSVCVSVCLLWVWLNLLDNAEIYYVEVPGIAQRVKIKQLWLCTQWLAETGNRNQILERCIVVNCGFGFCNSIASWMEHSCICYGSQSVTVGPGCSTLLTNVVVRPHRVRSVRCRLLLRMLSVCLSVRNIGQPSKYDWGNRNVVCGCGPRWSKELYVRCYPGPPRGKAVSGGEGSMSPGAIISIAV